MTLPKQPVANVYPSDKLGFTLPRFGGAVSVKFNTVAFTDTTAKELFRLPTGTFILDLYVDVTTVFNSSGTDLLRVGTSATDNLYVNDLSVAALGRTRSGAAATVPITSLGIVLTTETAILGKFTQSVADATTGLCTVVMFYIVKT